ncbi:hypothetical protein BDZ45DRAFT_809674 [Acephala macrosclerotiorum]|nr:hypothetical protein BDZ45DRAFT_809674 [Acephala macrosclerotiorum]
MHFHLATTLGLACAAVPATATLTYWIDPGCLEITDSQAWDTIMAETFRMAKRASERVYSDTDTDFAAVFKRIFGVDKTDLTTFKNIYATEHDKEDPQPLTAKNFVGGMLDSISHDWTSVTGGSEEDRLASNVRIYCDQDARWKPFPKHADAVYDPNNLMLYDASKSPRCVLSTATFAKVYSKRMKITPKRAQHNPHRNTITICDKLFSDAPDGAFLGFFNLDPSDDLSQLPYIEAFRFSIPAIILHEFTHVWPYRTSDAGYGWDESVHLVNNEERVNNADSFMYLGLWALLADYIPQGGTPGSGFTLPRLITRVTRSNQAEAIQLEADAMAGKLVAYKNLTKRWLKTIARYFNA